MRRGDPPERPAPSDCCNSGCSPCVTDLYEEALRRYELGLDDADGDAAQVALDPLSYREFTVTSVEWFPLTSAPTLRLSFSLPASCPRLGLAAGQHLWLRSRALGDDSADEVVSRPYTPITPPGVSPIGLYISLRDGGPMHRYLLHVSAGDTVSLRGPGGGFSLRTNRWHSITMIAGGTGIAPMLQVARAILANDRDDTSIKVIWSVRTFADAEPLGALLQSLTEYVTFKICFVVTRPEVTVPPKWASPCEMGERLDGALYERLVPRADKGKRALLLCGSAAFAARQHELAAVHGYSDDTTLFSFADQ